MARLLTCALALGGLPTPSNAAVVKSISVTRVDSTRYLAEAHTEHEQRLGELERTLSVDGAVELLRNQSATEPKLAALLQQVSTKQQGHLRAGQSQSDVDDSAKPRNANTFLNDMIQEVQKKYDMELRKCCEYADSQGGLIEESRQDISLFNTEAAEARKECLESKAQIDLCEKKLPELKEMLLTSIGKCNSELKVLKKEQALVGQDLGIMKTILKVIKCKKPTAMFLQCTDACGDDYYSFKQDELHNQTVLLSENVRDALHVSMYKQVPTNATKKKNSTKAKRRFMKRRSPCKRPTAMDPRSSKCSMATSPNCPKLRGKFVRIQGGLQDKFDDLQDEIDKLTKTCETNHYNLNSQISGQEALLKDQQTALSAATKKQTGAEEQSRLKGKELAKLLKEYDHTAKLCHKNYATFEGEECGLKKIRGELVKLEKKGKVPFFQDCVVTQWVPGQCSATCGGGKMVMKRSVTTKPGTGGVPCPPLTASKPCNDQKCPIDCVLEDWSGWSTCSAKCGGGVMERQRSIRIRPEHGGDPCGQDSESTGCNIQSCDKDCTLYDWTSWSKCSKMCNGGTSVRQRNIKTAVEGDGTCPSKKSGRRLALKKCNTKKCKLASGAQILQCRAKLDVVLVLDDSGSIGRYGWKSTKRAALMLADSFGSSDADVSLAILLFSSRTKWVQHFSTNYKKTKANIKKMRPQFWGTRTDKALAAAQQELNLGRAGARSVVIVFTDGRPARRRWMLRNAKRLRRKTRLMWIPVTRFAPLYDIRRCASYPLRDNIVSVRSFWHLRTPRVVNSIISDVCPKVRR